MNINKTGKNAWIR